MEHSFAAPENGRHNLLSGPISFEIFVFGDVAYFHPLDFVCSPDHTDKVRF